MSENTVNEQGNQGRSVTEGLPWRYRFTDADGKLYAPFRLRPGFTIRDVIAEAFPDGDGEWTCFRFQKI